MLPFRSAHGNAKGRTHSETSSNYLCTNDGWENAGMTPSRARSRPPEPLTTFTMPWGLVLEQAPATVRDR